MSAIHRFLNCPHSSIVTMSKYDIMYHMSILEFSLKYKDSGHDINMTRMHMFRYIQIIVDVKGYTTSKGQYLKN